MGKNGRKQGLQAGLIALTCGVVLVGIVGSGEGAAPVCAPVECKDRTADECVADQKKHHESQLGDAIGWKSTAQETIDKAPEDHRTGAKLAWEDVKKGLESAAKSEVAAAKAAKANKLAEVKKIVLASTTLACETKVRFDTLLQLVAPVEEPVVPDAADTSTATPTTAPTATTAPVAPPETFPTKKALCEKECQSPGAFCIDVDTGEPFCKEVQAGKGGFELPGKMREGDSWIVRVAGEEGSKADFELKIGEIKSADHLWNDKGTKGGARYQVLKEITYKVPASADVSAVEVLFTRKDKEGANARYEVPVDHGRYYLDVGILVPIVPFGKRTITQTNIPGTSGEKRLSLNEDYQVEASIALNVYPCGRRRGLWSAFQQVSTSTLCDLFGLQLGLNMDLKNAFDRIYAGLTLTPIAGVGVGFGLAFVKGQFFPAGYSNGMLIPKGETFTPDDEYMIRPYLGITLSTEILTTIAAVKSPF